MHDTLRRHRRGSTGLLGLALGYFAWYIPYAALTRALSAGLLPGLEGPVPGFVLLPAAALGTLAGMLAFLTLSGWWRYARRSRVVGLDLPWPRRETLASACWAALIIGTTTLNYTFPGVSILLMLLLMRAGVLILSPIVDAARRRAVQPHSWVALGLSLLAVTIALSDVDSYQMTLAAALSLGGYLLGYAGRFDVMSRHAKQGEEAVDRRYFVEEHLGAPLVQVALLGLLALAGWGQVGADLRRGFTTFLATEPARYAFLIGLLYEGLFIFGTLIYLDRREYTYCVPVNRCASVLAIVVASAALTWLADVPPPSAAVLAGTAVVVLALLVLSYPALAPQRKLLLFVCGANTCRSPMAAAIARAELGAARPRAARWEARSAGLAVARAGAPMQPEAAAALTELGVPPGRHRSRALTPELVARAVAVYCMTRAQRELVLEMVPEARGKVFCLDPERDVAEPARGVLGAYHECARQVRELVRRRLHELGCYPVPGLEGA